MKPTHLIPLFLLFPLLCWSAPQATLMRQAYGVRGVSAAWSPASLNPVAWYKLNGSAVDSYGTNNATWVGGAVYTNGPYAGVQSAYFGDSRFLVVSNQVAFNLTNSLSVSAWINANDAALRGIVAVYDTSSKRKWMLAQRGSGDGGALEQRSGLFLSQNGLAATEFYSTTLTINMGWHHVVATWNGSVVNIYCDGALESGPTAFSSPLYGSGVNLLIGSFYLGGDPTVRRFNGSVSDVLIFNRGLSSNEVSQIYNWRN